MKYVLSFWSKPSEKNGGLKVFKCRWRNPLLHMCGWIISSVEAKKHGHLELVTDSNGASVFADTLHLPFDTVKTTLDSINHIDPGMWMSGKLKAYSIQSDPFIHLDSDVFLWKELPENILKSEMAAQHLENPENNKDFNEVYGRYLNHLKSNNINRGMYLDDCKSAYNCGIFGGNNIDRIKEYSEAALGVVENNNYLWESVSKKIGGLAYCNAVVEQLLYANFANQNNIKVETIFPVHFTDQDADAKGYTHLMNSKLDPSIERNATLWEKIRIFTEKKYPDYYYRAEKFLAN